MVIKAAHSPRSAAPSSRGYTMVEILVAVSLVAVMFVTLYSGFSAGFAVIQLARENLRATQILQEKMETIRLYTWDQINKPGFVPTNFVDYYYTSASNVASGLTYTGSVSIASAPVTESYKDDLKTVKITIQWKSAGVLRSRDVTTFVTRHGLQEYIY